VNTMSIILLVVLIIVIAKARRGQLDRWSRYDRRQFTADQAAHSQREAELEREVEELRERIQVLERIATDDRSAKQLSDEIEKLRDK